MDAANKRIAKNTLYLYFCLFTNIFLGLYTSRIVLQVLGVSDYGLFNVVGGVLTMFLFISASLNAATSRFLNAEMGKPNGDVNRIFNVNVTLHTVFALVIVLLAESVGLWYVYNKLSVAPGRIHDAVFIFHITVGTAFLGITNVPYSSLLSSHERFKFMTTMEIFNKVVQFCCIFLLQFYEGPYTLRIYAAIVSLTTINTFVVYHWIAAREWPEIIKLHFVKEWSNYKEVLSFVNWNMLSTMSTVARNAGSDLVINIFFGTSVNGSFTVGKSMNQYVGEFSNRFESTSAPQIIQAYAASDKNRYMYLVNKLGRINLLLFLLLIFPLYIELDFVLHLWLGTVPDGALLFAQLNLVLVGVTLTGGGLYNLVHASGQIKWFKIEMSILFLSCIPLGYLLLSLGFPAYTMIVLFIMAEVLQRIIQIILAHYILEFDSWKYVKEAYTRPLIIIIIMATFIYLYSFIQPNDGIMKFVSIIVCFLINASCIYCIGLKIGERETLRSAILSKIGLLRTK